jgi:SNF2 family DNA or RNA helicase
VTEPIMETDNKQNIFTRVITVKKRGGVPPVRPKVGIDRFDEYIEKSGLEPKKYQREGVEFCLRRESRDGASCASGQTVVIGGIIADEMGLGKTIVMMGLILANLAAYRRTLIVVPVALIAQWVAQLKRTIIDTGVKPDLTVIVYHGSAGKRRVVLSEGGDGIVWRPRPPKNGGEGKAIDIVITTYGCVAMEEPAAKPPAKPRVTSSAASLLTFRADRVIFDEAHHLRNKNSRVFKGAMRVVGSAAGAGLRLRPSVWIVTGTPIQNKISDLKSLCYVLGFGVGDLMTEERRRAIRDEYVLRRTKVSVGMVAGVEAVEAVEAVETGVGVGVTCAPRLQSLKHYKSNVPWSSENECVLSRDIHCAARNTTDRAERLKLYTRMRQMCVWPALLTKPNNNKKKEESLEEEDTHGFANDEFNAAISKQSKMDRVVATMVVEAEAAAAAADGGSSGRKSIVFCHYRREMARLREMLLRSGSFGGGGCDDIAIIDGAVGPRERARIFATEPRVLILQIRTCSEGLNLQSYSDVYFVSPHWNPCVEDQAIARCYRMGQTNRVRVFRFYMSNFVAERSGDDAAVAGESPESISTLDHKCEEIQERKRVLCNEFLG